MFVNYNCNYILELHIDFLKVLIISLAIFQEPLKSADEVIKEIDDIIEAADDEDDDEDVDNPDNSELSSIQLDQDNPYR